MLILQLVKVEGVFPLNFFLGHSTLYHMYFKGVNSPIMVYNGHKKCNTIYILSHILHLLPRSPKDIHFSF